MSKFTVLKLCSNIPIIAYAFLCDAKCGRKAKEQKKNSLIDCKQCIIFVTVGMQETLICVFW